MIIDPHVHLRGEEYNGQDFIMKGFQDAKILSIQAMLEMPNPDPQLTAYETCENRIREADIYRGEVYHGINIGLTNDIDQVRNALEYLMNHPDFEPSGPNRFVKKDPRGDGARAINPSTPGLTLVKGPPEGPRPELPTLPSVDDSPSEQGNGCPAAGERSQSQSPSEGYPLQ